VLTTRSLQPAVCLLLKSHLGSAERMRWGLAVAPDNDFTLIVIQDPTAVE
jgi:hypothetical protein